MRKQRTLLEMARLAERYGRRSGERVVGGFANGRTETSITVLGMVNGMVALEQGATSDKVFVDPGDAVQMIILDHGKSRR